MLPKGERHFHKLRWPFIICSLITHMCLSELKRKEGGGRRGKRQILDVSSQYSSGTQNCCFPWILRHTLCLQKAKIPWRKVCNPTNYPDVFSVKMLNIWVFVPIQVIGWVWPFSSGDLAQKAQPRWEGLCACVWWSAKLDNLLLIQLLLGAKDGDKICLSPPRGYPPQTHCFWKLAPL